MKNLAIVLFFLLWLLTTIILTISIIGIFVMLFMSDGDWFDIPQTLADKLN